MIPIYCKNGQEMRNRFEKLVNWYGKKELILVYIENNTFNFYLNREVKSTETDNVNDGNHCSTKGGREGGEGEGGGGGADEMLMTCV